MESNSLRRQTKRVLFLILPLFLPGFLAAIWRCSLRWTTESQNRFVETVIDFEEMRRLAREEGWSLEKVLKEARLRGASSIGLAEDTLSTLQAEGRITILTFEDVQKLGLSQALASQSLPYSYHESPGSLWLYSQDSRLLDRIEQQLLWKLPVDLVKRIHRNMLVVRKSSIDFRERVGVGFSSEYLEMAQRAGLGVVLRVYNYPGLKGESLQAIIKSLPQPASVSAILFAEEEILGNRGDLLAAISSLYERAYRIGWIEFNDQQGMPNLLARLQGRRPIVRVHSISRRELDEVYNVERAVARFVRAVRDRSLKMLYIRCFFQDKKKFIADLVQFNMAYIELIARELKSWGYAIASTDEERRHEPRHLAGTMPHSMRLAIGLALIFAVPLSIGLARRQYLLTSKDVFTTLAATIMAWLILAEGAFTTFVGLLGAIAIPILGCLWAITSLETESPAQSLAPSALQAARFLIRLSLPSFIGGTLIAGLHSETPYLLHFTQFRGIKLAFLLPLLIVFIWSLRRFGGGIFKLLARPLTLREGFLIVFVLTATLLYLLRSGNVTFLKPSEVEDLTRTFLENMLVARPRNKEFLIGYPAAFLFLFYWGRGLREILPILALFLVMGQVSVVNTFCHFHSPLYLAYLRGFNGLWLGTLFGLFALVALVILRVIAALGQKDRQVMLVGYFGFGNLGDEILWRVFQAEASRLRPELEWLVIHATGKEKNLPPHTSLVSRQSPAALLEAIASAKALIIPGGGVLQASTSLKSLLYYSFILGIGRLGGARLLLPSQGLGPWQPLAQSYTQGQSSVPSIYPALAKLLVRMLIDEADYFSVRDDTSLSEARHFPGPPLQVNKTTDLVFLLASEDNLNLQNEAYTRSDGRLRLGVILRKLRNSSHINEGDLQQTDMKMPKKTIHPEKALADLLCNLSKQLENLDLIPFAFQSPDDFMPWGENIRKTEGTVDSEASSIAMVKQLTTFEEALTAIKDVDILLSMRMHGCLIATLAGVPWIGIDIDPKIRGLGKTCGWPHVYAPNELLDSDRLILLLDELMAKRAEITKQLRNVAAAQYRLAAEDVSRCMAAI